MSRIKFVDINSAPEKSKPNLQALNAKLGSIPNIFKAMANSPAALGVYVSITGALNDSTLSAQTREAMALAIAEHNGCEYCLSAHTLIGSKSGLSDTDIESAREWSSKDAKTAAILKLTKTLLKSGGQVSDTDFAAAKKAGITDGEFADVCAVIALNVMTNYFNIMSQNEVDFPKVEPKKKAA